MKKENLLYHTTFIIRITVLLLTVFLFFNGIGVFADTKENVLFMYANLTNFSFWVIFMMGSIVISPLGRFFCALCPAGEINYLTSKIGFKRRLNLGMDFIQGFSLIAVFTLVIVFHFSRHPHTTSILIISVLILSALMGFFYRGNSFCLTICPANAYLRFYSKLSLFKLFCKDNAKTSNCMVFLNPCNVKKENCHLCFRCFKDANGISLKRDTNPFISLTRPLTNTEIFVFAVLSGLTIMAFIRVVREVRELFVYPPYLIAQYIGLPEQYLTILLIIFGVFIYPIFFYSAFVLLLKNIKKTPFLHTAKSYIPYFIPLIMSVHLILAITKINARIGFLPFAIKDPSGKDMVQLYALGKADIPSDLINIVYFKYLILSIPVIVFLIMCYLIQKNIKLFSEKIALLFSQLFFVIFIEYCIVNWLFKGFLS